MGQNQQVYLLLGAKYTSLLDYHFWIFPPPCIYYDESKAPLHTKLNLMDCGIGNTNLLGSSSSVLGYDCFNMKSTDGATMYFNLGSGIGSGRIQTDY